MDSFDVVNTELVIVELLTLVVTLLVLTLLFFLVRRAMRGGGLGTGPSAREALDRRYANGEMTREEYLTIRDDIMREQNA
jgi:putative membrane protein